MCERSSEALTRVSFSVFRASGWQGWLGASGRYKHSSLIRASELFLSKVPAYERKTSKVYLRENGESLQPDPLETQFREGEKKIICIGPPWIRTLLGVICM